DLAVHSAEFSPDGAAFAIFASKADQYSGEISVIDSASGRTLASYTLAELTANHERYLRFTVDGRSLVITGASKTLVWRWAGRPEPPAPAGHQFEVWGLAYSPDGRTLASSSDDYTIKLWDTATGNLNQTLTGHESMVSAVKFS